MVEKGKGWFSREDDFNKPQEQNISAHSSYPMQDRESESAEELTRNVDMVALETAFERNQKPHSGNDPLVIKNNYSAEEITPVLHKTNALTEMPLEAKLNIIAKKRQNASSWDVINPLDHARNQGITLPADLDRDLYQQRAVEMLDSMQAWSKATGMAFNHEKSYTRVCYAQTRIADLMQTEFESLKPASAYREAEKVALLEATAWMKDLEEGKPPKAYYTEEAMKSYQTIRHQLMPSLIEKSKKKGPYLSSKNQHLLSEQEAYISILFDAPASKEMEVMLLSRAYAVQTQEKSIDHFVTEHILQDKSLKTVLERHERSEDLLKGIKDQLMNKIPS